MKKFDFWKHLSAVYFPLQFLVVHIAFFGFVFAPERLAIVIPLAINWVEIFQALWNFRMVFILGFTFQSALVFIIVAIPYTLVLLWALRWVLLYLFVLHQLVWFCIIRYRQWKHERRINLDNVVVVKIGAPGCGKSSSGLYEAVVMAQKMWKELQWKYYKYQSKKDKPIDWDEVKFSYEFFKNNKCVPCLLSNIPVMIDGKFTTFVSKAHCEQRERLPAHCVLFLDEVGAMLTVDTAKARMGDDEDSAQNAVNVSDFFRLCRHFGNWRIICTEQDSENIYIDVRRVVSKNEYMLYQRWVLKPYLFLAVFLPLKTLVINAQWTNRFFAPPLMLLEKLCKSIGFRKYGYITENNTERASGMECGKRTFYLPSLLRFKYDERTFRNFYKCKNQKIEPVVFKNLVLEDTDFYKQMFLRSVPKRKRQG